MKRDGERTTKPPINPNVPPIRPLEERLASPLNPGSWSTYERAQDMSRHYAGIGFMFSNNDALCGIDLDKCRNPHDGHITKWAMNIITLLGSYTEISPSGTGIHIIIKASMLTAIEHLGRSTLQHRRGHIEIYDERRYFTWSGNPLPGFPTVIASRQDELTDLYRSIFPESEEQHEGGMQAQQFLASTPVDLSDEWIIERAALMRSNGARFARLWRGDASDYTRADGSVDQSRADQALLGILAYWTGRDSRRMEALFQHSGLYRPERWARHARTGETYGSGSIRIAIANCRSTYDPAWAEKQRSQSQPQNAETCVSAIATRRGGGE